jgi:hypothetical protein
MLGFFVIGMMNCEGMKEPYPSVYGKLSSTGGVPQQLPPMPQNLEEGFLEDVSKSVRPNPRRNMYCVQRRLKDRCFPHLGQKNSVKESSFVIQLWDNGFDLLPTSECIELGRITVTGNRRSMRDCVAIISMNDNFLLCVNNMLMERNPGSTGGFLEDAKSQPNPDENMYCVVQRQLNGGCFPTWFGGEDNVERSKLVISLWGNSFDIFEKSECVELERITVGGSRDRTMQGCVLIISKDRNFLPLLNRMLMERNGYAPPINQTFFQVPPLEVQNQQIGEQLSLALLRGTQLETENFQIRGQLSQALFWGTQLEVQNRQIGEQLSRALFWVTQLETENEQLKSQRDNARNK